MPEKIEQKLRDRFEDEFSELLESNMYDEIENYLMKIVRIAFAAGKAAQLSEREKDE